MNSSDARLHGIRVRRSFAYDRLLRDKRTEDIFHGRQTKRVLKLPQELIRVMRRKLDMINAATGVTTDVTARQPIEASARRPEGLSQHTDQRSMADHLQVG